MSVPSPALVRAVDTRGEPSPDVSHRRHSRMVHVAPGHITRRTACGRGVQVLTDAAVTVMLAAARNCRPPAAGCAAYDALPGRRHASRQEGWSGAPSRQRGSVARVRRTP